MRQQKKTSSFIAATTLLTLVFACVAAICTSTQANAAAKGVSQTKVLAACKRTADCHYNGGKGGGAGCTNNVCFMCNGKTCFADMKGKAPGTGATIGGVRLPPGPVQSASGKTRTGVRHPVNVGVANGPTKLKEPMATENHGGMKQGGRRH
jgi:hypothetical protein